MVTIYTVLLECGTVGAVCDDTLGQHPDTFIGEELDVRLRDENGNPIMVRGTMKETLSSSQVWE